MKFVLVTKDGDSLPLVQRLQAEGHTVRAYQEEPKYQQMLGGMVETISKPEIPIFNPDLVINLETSMSGFSESLSAKGLKVLGGFKLHEQLESDRMGALEFAKSAKILIPETKPFEDGSEAIKFLDAAKLRMCCKFNEDGGDKFLSFLGKSNRDVQHFIEQKYRPEKHKGLILQEYIEGPAELNVEAWFSRGKLIWPMNAGMEQKRFLAGDMGPNTGCMSNICWPVSGDSLIPWTSGMLDRLKDLKYSGPIDMAFKVGKDHKFYFLEFTPRAGINAIFGLVDLIDEDFGKFLVAVESGRATQMVLRPEYAFNLTVSVYPYPYEIPSVYTPGMEVKWDKLKGNFWPLSVRKTQSGFVTAAGYPLVGYTSATDPVAGRAIRKSQAIAEGISVSGKQFRIDSDEVLEKVKLFHSMGIRKEGWRAAA